VKPIRIVLADDHALMREGTRRALEQSPDMTVVGETGDGQEALELLKRLKPDVAILDIRMPGMNGIEVVREMKECCPKTRALILSAYDDDDYILALMDAGALGYVLKTAEASDLVQAVRSVHSGEPVLDPVIAAKVARLWAHSRDEAKKDALEELSPREREVLQLGARGFRNKDIADNLHISVRTAEGHFNNIFNKLNVTSRVEAVLYALSHQLVILE